MRHAMLTTVCLMETSKYPPLDGLRAQDCRLTS
jgi:hypothetical protein